LAEYVYHFSGKVIPDRAGVTFLPATFHVDGGADVPPSSLLIQIIVSQIFARLTCPSPIVNHKTARNMVEDSVRAILDAYGFVFARGYEVEITQYFAIEPMDDYVYGVDFGALEGRAVTAGLSPQHLLYLMSTPSSWFFRRALSDFREALRNSTDTGFFCFRAVETLMQQHASTRPPTNDKAKWIAFREYYGVSEDQIRQVKAFADPVRHGNGLQLLEMTSADTIRVFELAWDIGIKVFLRAYSDNPPPVTDAPPSAA
jgi:hypothetical protein